MDIKTIVIEKRLSLLGNKYEILSDIVYITNKAIRVKIKTPRGLPYILRANL